MTHHNYPSLLSKIIFVLLTICLLTCFSDLQAQTKKENESADVFPKFDLHLGIGRINGLNAGGRILINNFISFETAVGTSLHLSYIKITEVQSNDPVFSLGVNGNFWDKRSLSVGITSTFLKEYNKKFQLIYLSPTVGVLVLDERSLHFFIRIGPYFRVNSPGNKNEKLGVNIDLGLNFVIN